MLSRGLAQERCLVGGGHCHPNSVAWGGGSGRFGQRSDPGVTVETCRRGDVSFLLSNK